MNINQVDLLTHPLSGVSLIEASAGTGKTYTISHLYVRCLLETEFGVEQILVVTFTNAATQELKGRIRKLIAEVRQYLLDETQQNETLGLLFKTYRLDQQAIYKLQRALINFDEASIFSIHGFCQRVLTRYPVETRSLLQQQIIADEKDLLSFAVRDYWRQQIIKTDLPRLEWILGNWNGPDELLADAMPLIKFKQDTQQPDHTSQLLIKTLESLWQSLCQQWKLNAGEIESVLIDNPALSKVTFKKETVTTLLQQLEQLFQQDLPYRLPEKWDLITREKLTRCLKKNSSDSRIDDRFFIDAGELLTNHEIWLRKTKIELLFDVANSIHKRVDEQKRHALNISFDDLISQLSTILEIPGHSLPERITRDFPVAMVDEFQDTDYRQYFIFHTLYQQRQDTTLILIGDPKQAIYSFRGADVFTYQQAKKNTAHQYTLKTNYRSSEQYIDVVNRVFAYNKNAFVIDQLIDFNSADFDHSKPRHLSDRGKPGASLVSWIYPFSEKPANKASANEYFAQVCAREIAHILNEDVIQIDGKRVQAKDLAVLVKTGHQAGLVKQQLSALGISSAQVLRDSVFATTQARELSLLLEVLIDPNDIQRLSGLLSTDLFCWNAAQIFNLKKNNDQLVELLEQMKAYQLHWQEKGILSMFFCLLQQQKTLQNNRLHMEAERRITNWLHIVELLQQQSIEHASQRQALQWLKRQRQNVQQAGDNEEHQLRLESDSELVRIVTIHKSKGLEYPIVFLPFMWNVKDAKNQPGSYSVHDETGRKKIYIHDESERERWYQESLAEEVRLFYVAMTRAQYRCYLGWGNIKGAGSSAIAQCLYSNQIKSGSYPRNLDVKDAESLRLPFMDMNQKGQRVKIAQQLSHEPLTLDTCRRDVSVTKALPFKRHVERQWRVSSYSQMASSGLSDSSDRPDYDAVFVPRDIQQSDSKSTELNKFSFHKGARAGNFLHELLERQQFDADIDNELIEKTCLDYGFELAWLPCLQEWIGEILSCQLNDFKLKDIKPRQKISEMEFYMSCSNLRPQELNNLLHQHQYSRPEQQFTFATIKGFVKGFIDLVFEHDGRYFIADYKSNYLGGEKENYSQAACKEAMYDHHYHLQYLIYTLALHRYLKQRKSDYQYQNHFGGVYYLYLRGMTEQDEEQHGIFFHRPDIQVIEQLDTMFSGGLHE